MIERHFKPEATHPLHGVEPGLPTDDLDAIAHLVAGARVVGLGEPTHGQKEINQMRDRLTRYLVEHHGFRVVAMEDSATQCRKVNEYVIHGNGSAETTLGQQFFWTWRTRETLAMIEWLREWNTAHSEDPVRFIGVDIQNLIAPVTELSGVLGRMSPDFATELESILTPLGAVDLWDDGSLDFVKFDTYNATLKKIRDSLLGSEEIVPNDFNLGMDCVLSLEQSLCLWRAISNPNSDESAAQWNLRDEFMANRTLAPTAEGQKVVLWAHNSHIQCDGSYLDPSGAVTTGQVLQNHLSSAYTAIAGMFGSGGYRAVNLNSVESWSIDVGLPPVGSLEHELTKTLEEPAALINLRDAEPILFDECFYRSAGAEQMISNKMITRVRPANAWHAIAFVRQASPSEPL